MIQSRPSSYHHGDLRSALLRAVSELVLEKGIEGLTLRECARRAGVSHAAPAHHFRDKTGLLTAFAVQGYHLLAQSMAEARDAFPESQTVDRLMAVGRGYIRFAVLQPAYFRVMFRAELLDQADPHLLEAGHQTYGILHHALRACDDAAGRPGAEATFEARALLAWSAVHGFAALWQEGIIRLEGSLARSHEAASGLVEALLTVLQPALSTPT